MESPRLWELNDPYLYRVTARVSGRSATPSFDEQSTRCGFRDFRLENGYFRLNGKRLFLKSSHSGCEVPVGMNVALDPDLLRKDLLNCKVMGMNMIRSFTGLASRLPDRSVRRDRHVGVSGELRELVHGAVAEDGRAVQPLDRGRWSSATATIRAS